jgi:hypothetical protein
MKALIYLIGSLAELACIVIAGIMAFHDKPKWWVFLIMAAVSQVSFTPGERGQK